jgi:glycolate oxidase iron-sulfur subunit
MATTELDGRRHDSAFDGHRPPSAELIADCVHCGFCLPTCPTYALWGEEMDSPRGRIVLMSAGLEDATSMSDAMVTHFDRCLGCMACVTACPSGVRYDQLIERTRPQVERNHARPLGERLFRRLLFELFTHPARLRALAPAAVALRRGRVARRMEPLLQRFPRLATLHSLTPDVSLSRAWSRLPEHTGARAARRGTAGLLLGCVQRVFFADVNAATARVLSAEGFDVVAPRSPRCCGALQLHTGYEVEAKRLAKATIAAFEDCDVVVVNAAGCGSAMKDYRHLLADEPSWAKRAEAFSSKVADVCELLAGVEPVAVRRPLSMRIAYHDACHLAHAQRVRQEPRALLGQIPELEVVEPAEWEICCGSAGVYNLLQPEAAAELGRRKATNLLGTNAQAIAAGNPGCTLQIAAHLRALGRPLPIWHPVQLLDASIRGARP